MNYFIFFSLLAVSCYCNADEEAKVESVSSVYTSTQSNDTEKETISAAEDVVTSTAKKGADFDTPPEDFDQSVDTDKTTKVENTSAPIDDDSGLTEIDDTTAEDARPSSTDDTSPCSTDDLLATVLLLPGDAVTHKIDDNTDSDAANCYDGSNVDDSLSPPEDKTDDGWNIGDTNGDGQVTKESATDTDQNPRDPIDPIESMNSMPQAFFSMYSKSGGEDSKNNDNK